MIIKISKKARGTEETKGRDRRTYERKYNLFNLYYKIFNGNSSFLNKSFVIMKKKYGRLDILLIANSADFIFEMSLNSD